MRASAARAIVSRPCSSQLTTTLTGGSPGPTSLKIARGADDERRHRGARLSVGDPYRGDQKESPAMSTHTTHSIVGGRPRPPTRTRASRAGRELSPHRFGLAIAAAIAVIPLGMASPIAAAERVVHPGESIQVAIDSAHPGDTIRVAPGTYHESITIATDGVTVVSAGADKTHIRPPAEADNPCAAQGFGVCIVGQFDENFDLVRPVADVRLSNLSVSGFTGVDQSGEPVGVGVFVLGGDDTTVDHVVAADNAVFGFTSILSSGDHFRHDTAYSNGYAGFQIAGEHGVDPATAGSGYRLEHVVAYDNRFGVIVHAASGGVIVGADLHDNCVGAMFSGPDTSHWEMKDTELRNNNRVCDALPAGDPAISGAGVAILGADHITIRHSTVTANRPSAGSAFAGGIIVGSTPTPRGARPSNNITVTKNEANGNAPADIIWDGTGTAIDFTRNECETSAPAGLCS